jgi:apolipoprotein N-acyltransferase
MASRPDHPTRTPRSLVPLVAMLASAGLFYVGYGLTPVAAVAWLAPIPVLLVAPLVRTRTSAGIALGAYLLGEANVAPYYLHSHDVPLPMGIAIVIGTALLFAGFVTVFRTLLARGKPLIAAVVAPALWTAVLYLSGLASPIGIMGTLMSTQADFPAVLQIASITGQWGLEYLVLVVPTFIAVGIALGANAAGRLRATTALALVGLGVLGFGLVRMSTGHPPASWRVGLLVHDHAPWGSDVGAPEGKSELQSYVDEISALPPDVDMVVLPEGAFAADDASLPTLVDPLSQIAKERGTSIVVGLMLSTGGKRYNTAFVIPPDAAPIMYKRWNNAGADVVLAKGTELALLPGDNQVGMETCGDVNFQNPTRSYASAGATFMAIPASDEDVNGRQHAVAGMLRGIENGLSIAWSGQRGTLMLSDAYGRVLGEDRTDQSRPFVTVIAAIPPGPGATFYTRTGDWFPRLCVAAALAAVIYAFLTRRTRDKEPHPVPLRVTQDR